MNPNLVQNLIVAEALSHMQIPQAMVRVFEQDPFIAVQYAADAGVWEGYTIKEHTIAVMMQFEKYFSDKLPDGIDIRLFRRTLALHDIGKPKAIAEGDKAAQHEYNADYIEEVLSDIGEREENIKLAKALVSGDLFGEYLEGEEISVAITKAEKYFKDSGIDRARAYQLLKILYQVDAGSYTLDASVPGVIQTKESLDWLFEFYPDESRMDFSAEIRPKVDNLEAALKL